VYIALQSRAERMFRRTLYVGYYISRNTCIRLPGIQFVPVNVYCL